MATVPVRVKKEVFERLQMLAVPLVENTSDVIERLVKHYEGSHPVSPKTHPRSVAVWRSARGEAFPVGVSLRGAYLGKTYNALVTARGIEFGGVVYDNPSSAGIAAKNSAGISGSAANTNGWRFWEMLDTETQRWVSINTLR